MPDIHKLNPKINFINKNKKMSDLDYNFFDFRNFEGRDEKN